MRILLTLHSFLPEPMFGTESAAIAQMREMLVAGHEIALFYAGNVPPAPGQLAAMGLGGLRLYRVAYWPTKAQVLLSVRKPHVERAFARALDEFRPEVVVFHHLVRLSLGLPAVAGRVGIPAAYVLHDFYWLCPSYSLFAWDADVCPGGAPRRCATCLYASRYGRSPPLPVAWLGAMIVRWRDRLARRALQEISLFLAPSAWLPAEMARRGIELAPTEVVANGQESDVAVMHRHDTQLPVRFGYIGGVSQKKGLSVLAEAFQGDLGRQLIIRGFPTEAELAAFRTAHPALHARLECFDSDRESFYRDVDVVVVPSLWLENQPMVVLEAFARGKPVIASRIGGLPQMFSDGEGGRFFAAGDAQSLRRVAAELAGDTAIVRRLAATIPRWPSWHESTAQILGHLERLVRARKSRPAAS